MFLGSGFSGEDISRDMSPEIEKGWLVARSAGKTNPEKNPFGEKENIYRVLGLIDELCEDGTVLLTNGDILENINTIVVCTGYAFNFPFLKEIEGLTMD